MVRNAWGQGAVEEECRDLSVTATLLGPSAQNPREQGAKQLCCPSREDSEDRERPKHLFSSSMRPCKLTPAPQSKERSRKTDRIILNDCLKGEETVLKCQDQVFSAITGERV